MNWRNREALLDVVAFLFSRVNRGLTFSFMRLAMNFEIVEPLM